MLKPTIRLQAFGANATRKWHRGQKVNLLSKSSQLLTITDIIRSTGKDYYPINAFLVCSAFVTFSFHLSSCLAALFLLAAWRLHHHVPLLPQCFALTLFAFSLYLRQSCRRLALHWCSREATITQTNRWFLLLQGNEELLSAIALSPGCTSSPFATWSIRIFGVCCFVFKVPQKWKWKLCVSWSL